MLYLRNETHRRVGLAAETRPLSLAADTKPFRCLPKRLGFANRKEDHQHLVARDDDQHQGAAHRCPHNHGLRRVLAILDRHHALTSKAWVNLIWRPLARSIFARQRPGKLDADRRIPMLALHFATNLKHETIPALRHRRQPLSNVT
jgi:hypothetical protein